MIKIPRLAVFDVDGTIAQNGKISPSIIDGMNNLHSKGCLTTISTGRGYIRLKEALGEHFNKIISPDALLILEHGTKIVKSNGEIVFGEFFNEREINHVIDFTRSNMDLYKLLWFNPINVNEKVQVWCSDEKDLEFECNKRGHYADVFTCSIGELEEILLKHKLTNITLKLKDYVKVENLKLSFTRTDTNVIFQDGNMEFIKNNINKGLALEYVANKLNVLNEDLLVAGNAINDVEMLDIESGITLIIGPQEIRSTIISYLSKKDKLYELDSTSDLGDFLAKI